MTNEPVRYHHTFRRTLLDMHIPDWDPQFLSQYEPEKLADIYAAANISGALFYCKSHMGLNYWPVPVGAVHPAARDRDLVGEMLAPCVPEGIAPAAYHSVIFDNWAVEHHPDWAIEPATTSKVTTAHLFGPVRDGLCQQAGVPRLRKARAITALLERYDLTLYGSTWCSGRPVHVHELQ